MAHSPTPLTPRTPPTDQLHRLDLGYFVRPAAEAGEPQPRVEAVLGYVLRRDGRTVLFDTGIGEADPETEAHYRPRRHPLRGALAAVGLGLDDVDLVVNCHLHFDHCGGNPLLPGTPILVQRAELAAARGGGHTVDALVDFTGAAYRELDGEAEILPGVWIIPTPGHTDGHQSLVVRRSDGSIVLAGQAHDFASQFAADVLARQAASDGAEPPLPDYRPWLDRLAEFDPRRVLFAHDNSAWEPASLEVPSAGW
ncbi:N-acyl homoserine lactonase family protein [Streptacidiphilus cavernicola]|uniref:N-acyl homoserine lactonase family protein n=1 Tax=Streptacidiphilus cavernicola TaxID=3342716 RepID=A0ABV6W3H4_9ACTN